MTDARVKVLLVEDSDYDAELALTALADRCHANEIVVVGDGEDALDYLYFRGNYADRPPGNPALIVLDIKMPKVDGLEVLRTIKTDERLKVIPVVMLTSSREEKDVVESYRLGSNAYVVKPLVFTEFYEAVRELGTFWLKINEPFPLNG
ncbi:MAG: response regulator [Burkholderiales bacterium]